MKKNILIGPFKQLLTMGGIPLKGAISDLQLPIIEDAGILIQNEKIKEIDSFSHLLSEVIKEETEILQLEGNHVCLPGFIDTHTHICFGGSRAYDYALRNAGKSYLEIANAGGGIWDTVNQTRKTTAEELIKKTLKRVKQHLKNGVLLTIY